MRIAVAQCVSDPKFQVCSPSAEPQDRELGGLSFMESQSVQFTTIYLLRHGATASNLESPPRLQGQGVDLSLSEVGRRQATITAQWFSSQSIAAVFASPLARSRETARAIAERHGVDVQLDRALIEADVGRWEGKNWREIAELDAEAHHLYRQDSARHGYPEGENMVQINARIAPAVSAIAKRCAGASIVIVGHGMANRALLAPLLGLPLSQASKLPQDNCGINVLRVADGEMKLATLNSTLHLDLSR